MIKIEEEGAGRTEGINTGVVMYPHIKYYIYLIYRGIHKKGSGDVISVVGVQRERYIVYVV